MNREVQRRIGRNEGLFRRVNEAIMRGVWPEDDSRVVAFRCECAHLECNQPVRATVAAYEQVRANPRRFILLPGHEVPESEVVVEKHHSYLVVEKSDEDAAAAAEEMDGRR